MLEEFFPYAVHNEVVTIQQMLVNKLTYTEDNFSIWFLHNGESIKIPYRMSVETSNVDKTINQNQNKIINCILTRSYDGYIRQKSIEELWKANLDEWMMPYVLKLTDEYIYSIVQLIYENLISMGDNKLLKEFCCNNAKNLRKGYERMISYWNEYYRTSFSNLKQYVGYKLYHECLFIDEI